MTSPADRTNVQLRGEDHPAIVLQVIGPAIVVVELTTQGHHVSHSPMQVPLAAQTQMGLPKTTFVYPRNVVIVSAKNLRAEPQRRRCPAEFFGKVQAHCRPAMLTALQARAAVSAASAGPATQPSAAAPPAVGAGLMSDTDPE